MSILVYMVTSYKLTNEVNLKISKPKSYVTVDSVDRVLDCLAINIYREAANESFEGKVAVAQVVLNRVDHPSFPKDICEVITQRNVIMGQVVCQFSWYCKNSSMRKPNNPEYRESYKVAKKVLLEGFRLDILNDALYYHAVYVNPKWPYQRITRIGNHIFYRAKK